MNSILNRYLIKSGLMVLTAIMASGLLDRGEAQTIYSDTLGDNDVSAPGAATEALNGSTPDTVDGNAIAPGTVGATWMTYGGSTGTGTAGADTWTRGVSYNPGGTPPDPYGAASTNHQDEAFLPFTPVSGRSYVLTATITPAPNSGGNMDTIFGFISTNTPSGGGGPNWGFNADLDGVIDTGDNAQNYQFYSGGNSVSSSGAYSVGSHPSGFGNSYPNPMTLTINLTSTGAGTWDVSATGTDANTLDVLFNTGTFALSTNDINYLGFFSEENISNVSNLSLIDVSVVPEPKTWGIMGLGLLALGMIRRPAVR